METKELKRKEWLDALIYTLGVAKSLMKARNCGNEQNCILFFNTYETDKFAKPCSFGFFETAEEVGAEVFTEEISNNAGDTNRITKHYWFVYRGYQCDAYDHELDEKYRNETKKGDE